MDYDEHHRLRQDELRKFHGLKHVQLATMIGVTPDYVSRLLYEPGKNGRKNLGPGVMRKISAAFNLQPGWFDLPLGQSLFAIDKEEAQTTTQANPLIDGHKVHEWIPAEKRAAPRDPIEWPFKIVTYQRIDRIRKHFSGRGMPSAISDIDKHLDVLVTRWENEITKTKSSAA